MKEGSENSPFRLEKEFLLGGSEIHAMRYGRGSNHLHVIDRSWEATIFDPNRNQVIRQYKVPVEAATCADWTEYGHHLAVGTWRGVDIFDAWTAERVTRLAQRIRTTSCVAWSPTNGYLAVATGSIRLWETASETFTISLDGHRCGVRALAWNGDATLLASADEHGQVFVWEIASATVILKFQTTYSMIHSLAWSPDSRFLAIPASLQNSNKREEAKITVFDFQKGEVVAEIVGPRQPPRALAFNPSGQIFGQILVSKAENLRFWRCDTWACVAVVPEDVAQYIIAPVTFQPFNHFLYTLGQCGKSVRKWSLDAKALLALEVPYEADPIADQIFDLSMFTPEQRIAAHGDPLGMARLLENVTSAKTPDEKGKALEALCKALFLTVNGFKVEGNIKTSTEEIDLTIQKWTQEIEWLTHHPFYILAECKNWSGKCGKNEYVIFKEKIANRRGSCNLGFLISWNGFADTVELESLRGSHGDVVIALLDGEDLNEACKEANFIDILFRAYDRAVTR